MIYVHICRFVVCLFYLLLSIQSYTCMWYVVGTGSSTWYPTVYFCSFIVSHINLMLLLLIFLKSEPPKQGTVVDNCADFCPFLFIYVMYCWVIVAIGYCRRTFYVLLCAVYCVIDVCVCVVWYIRVPSYCSNCALLFKPVFNCLSYFSCLEIYSLHVWACVGFKQTTFFTDVRCAVLVASNAIVTVLFNSLGSVL